MSDKYVSRGGTKLEHALKEFSVNPKDLTVLDIGSSTGGFVDCLLQSRASKVYALDTAYGELAWKLRNNPQVVVMERTNILHLASLPEQVDLITIDAGWTKLELILPIAEKFLKPNAQIIALLKPHYEAPKHLLQKGVLPENIAEEIKIKVTENIKSLGFEIQNLTDSPILGGGGNKEFLLLLTKRS